MIIFLTVILISQTIQMPSSLLMLKSSYPFRCKKKKKNVCENMHVFKFLIITTFAECNQAAVSRRQTKTEETSLQKPQ